MYSYLQHLLSPARPRRPSPVQSEDGVTAIEYRLIAALIAVASSLRVTAVGTS